MINTDAEFFGDGILKYKLNRLRGAGARLAIKFCGKRAKTRPLALLLGLYLLYRQI